MEFEWTHEDDAGMPSYPHLIDLDFCLDMFGRPAWNIGPNLGTLANPEIKSRLSGLLSRSVRGRKILGKGRGAGISEPSSRKQNKRWSLLIIKLNSHPSSKGGHRLELELFLKVATTLGWNVNSDVQRRTKHAGNLILDYWYVTSGREMDLIRILSTARKVAKAYALINEGIKYKDIRKDTMSIIKHISSLIQLLNRMDDNWYELVSQQDGRPWGKFESSIESQIIQNIDSIDGMQFNELHPKDELIQDLNSFSSKCFHAFVNLNEKTWKSRGTIPEKLLGSADLFTVTKSLLLLECFCPLQEGLHEAKAIAEVADAMKALALGWEGSKGYRAVPAGELIQWPIHHIHRVRAWRNRLQEAMDFMEEVETLAESESSESEAKTFLPVWRHQAKETLRELLQGPGHALRAELLEPSEVN